MQTIGQALDRLERSAFRSRFRLSEKDRRYLEEKGTEVIRRHAEDFVRQKLAPAEPANDGRQTPMRGHPVFLAMHATACCCRGCLEKWYRVPKGRPLTESQQKKIVDLLMAWIERQKER
jgi:exodeoxyribonuclease V alpha subunit